MSLILLDMGSGNTCKNDIGIIEEMVMEVMKADTKKPEHTIIFKWQLIGAAETLDGNRELSGKSFDHAFFFAERHGYQTTASVFTEDWVYKLIKYHPAFIKIACRPHLYYLNDFIPRRIPVYMSYYYKNGYPDKRCIDAHLCCVPKYPAEIEEYEKHYTKEALKEAVSDHTIGLELFKKYRPQIWEKHFVLEDDKDNPDAGPFALRPDDLKEIL